MILRKRRDSRLFLFSVINTFGSMYRILPVRVTLVFALFLTSLGAFAQSKVKWLTFDELSAAMEEEPRKVLIDVYTVWCGPCRMMTSNTFNNPEVAAYINENFYAIKFNGEGNDVVNFLGNEYTNPNYDPARAKTRNAVHQLTQAFQVSAYPTVVYLQDDMSLLTSVSGYWPPENYIKLLEFFEGDHYKTTSWEEFSAQ